MLASDGLVSVEATGAQAAPDLGNVRSPETYPGYERAGNFVSPGGVVKDAGQVYRPGMPRLNEWSLSGNWTIDAEHAALNEPDGAIAPSIRRRPIIRIS